VGHERSTTSARACKHQQLTEEDPHDNQTRIARYSSRTDGDDSPGNHDTSNPFGRRKVLQQDV
jgi:hypothetical protein